MEQENSQETINVAEQRENNGKMLGGITGKGFMPGQSGNPSGRPKGQSLKEYARIKLIEMSEEEKEKFLKKVEKKIIWEMAEGKAKQDMEFSGEVTSKIIKLDE